MAFFGCPQPSLSDRCRSSSISRAASPARPFSPRWRKRTHLRLAFRPGQRRLGGLGVGAQSARLRLEGTVAVGPEAGLPPLGETEFVVVPAIGRPSAPVEAMADTILEFGRAFHA